jgi:hypothetical protein
MLATLTFNGESRVWGSGCHVLTTCVITPKIKVEIPSRQLKTYRYGIDTKLFESKDGIEVWVESTAENQRRE